MELPSDGDKRTYWASRIGTHVRRVVRAEDGGIRVVGYQFLYRKDQWCNFIERTDFTETPKRKAAEHD